MSPEQKLARSRTRLLYLKELQKRPNLSPEGQKKLPGLIEMQEIAVGLREKVVANMNTPT
jgi:hypothetical protein